MLILARLLHKVLNERSEAIPLVDTLSSKLHNLRRKLLQSIDRRLSRHELDINDVVEDLTAFCLATSSSPSIALTHFHRLRASAIQRPQEEGDVIVRDRIQTRLALLDATIHQTRSIFPHLLSASLRTLGTRAVLDDEKVQQIKELKLDIHARWFSSDIRNYTPWTRHDELQRSAASEETLNWAKNALDILVESIQKDLGAEDNAEQIVQVRKSVLQTWLSMRSVVRGLPTKDALRKLRLPFTERCSELIHAVADSMQQSIKSSVIDQARRWDTNDQTKALPSLWDLSITSLDLSDGAASFRETLIDRCNGRTTEIINLVSLCDDYIEKLTNMHTAFKTMRETRWDDDDYEDTTDDDSDNDTEAVSRDKGIYDVLSREDPQTLVTSLNHSIQQMTQNLDSTISSAIIPEPLLIDTPTSPGIFLLRSLRVLRQRLPDLLVATETPIPKDLFAHDAVSALHNALAQSTTKATVSTLEPSLEQLLSRPLHIQALWDGTPPLPLQTSPAVFKFLRALVKQMEHVGTDVWNPEAVATLKREAVGSVVKAFHGAVSTTDCRAETRREQSPTAGPGAEADETSDDTADENAHRGNEEEQANDDAARASDTPSDAPAADAPHEDPTPDAPPADPTPDATHADAPRVLAPAHFTQLLHDALYLLYALMPLPSTSTYTAAEAESAFAPLVEDLERRAAVDGAGDAMGRLRKNAREYWRRSWLLFGLLGCG